MPKQKASEKSSTIVLEPRQHDLVDAIARHDFTLAYGSARGGKTFAFMVVLITRALMFPGSNHAVIRATASSIKSTVWPTMMAVLASLAPGFKNTVHVGLSDRRIELDNGSTIWFFGAQDDEAIEKMMGAEFATIFVNEIVDENFTVETYDKILTRLNANDVNEHGDKIDVKFFADCNPKDTKHWVHDLWMKKKVPGTDRALYNPDDFGWVAFDATSNSHIDPNYYNRFRNQGAKAQSRFLKGDWYDEVEGALFSSQDLDENRSPTPAITAFDMIVVAIDPAVTNGPNSDETGIFVAGRIGEDAEAEFYPIADLSGRYHPWEWAKIAVDAYYDYGAATIIVEVNQGGEMNVVNLHNIDRRVNVETVRPGVGQGKNERAKPIATLMNQGRIHHPMNSTTFEKLERQMLQMTGDYNRKKQSSPDRLDAYVYAMSELLTGDIIGPCVQSKMPNFMRYG